ncbi:MAG: Lrp/AsnC family transcriptional regulator [Acidobacteriota bacterium]
MTSRQKKALRIMDKADKAIIDCLQSNARCSNAEIARSVGLAPSAVLERIRKLERNGVLHGYEARLDPEAMGLGMLAFLFVRVARCPAEPGTAAKLAAIPEVLEVHHVAGEDCFLLKVRTSSTRGLHRILTDEFNAIGGIESTKSTIVLETVKETGKLPLPQLDEPGLDKPDPDSEANG